MDNVIEFKTDIRFNNITNVHRFLGRTANMLFKDEISTDKARCLGYLCGIMIKSIEIKDIEKRLNDIEKAINSEVG